MTEPQTPRSSQTFYLMRQSLSEAFEIAAGRLDFSAAVVQCVGGKVEVLTQASKTQ